MENAVETCLLKPVSTTFFLLQPLKGLGLRTFLSHTILDILLQFNQCQEAINNRNKVTLNICTLFDCASGPVNNDECHCKIER